MTALTHHGGRIDLAGDLYPHAPRPWLDLSTGINPYPWTAPADLAVDLHALPSPAALAGLEAAAAARFGVSADRVVALPGSEIGLRLLGSLDLPAPHRIVAPAYGTHRELFAGAAEIPFADLDGAAEVGGTILLANPNNPDGRLIPPAMLRSIGCSIEAAGGRLVVDEAFADAVDGASILPDLARGRAPGSHPVVFRSFGKFFGLAGIRLGFAIAPPPLTAALRARLGSWPVSATAMAYGTAAYGDEHWIATTRLRIAAAAAALDAVLGRHGLSPRGACPLFRLVETDDAPRLFGRLARAGILPRPFAENDRWLRIGLPGSDKGLDRLDRALTDG